VAEILGYGGELVIVGRAPVLLGAYSSLLGASLWYWTAILAAGCIFPSLLGVNHSLGAFFHYLGEL
jgi:hypothetical protein